MKLSIIIPYYNSGKWIKRCISSLLCQDVEEEEYEIIIVDDGSLEPTNELLSFISKYKNIKYIKQENKRQAVARNNGLLHAKGNYILFCDSDDFVEKNVFGKLLDIAKGNALDLLFYNVIEASSSSQRSNNPNNNFGYLSTITSGIVFYSHLPFRLKKGPWSCIINRHFLEENHINFPSHIVIREDSWFLISSLILAKRVCWVNVDVYYYVQNSQGLCHSIGKDVDAKKFCDSFLKYIEFLSGLKTDKTISNQIAPQLKNDINNVAFDLLHNAILYCSFCNNVKYIKELKKRCVYPIEKDVGWNNKYVLAFMNNTNAWIIMCFFSSLLPFKFRNFINNIIIRL